MKYTLFVLVAILAEPAISNAKTIEGFTRPYETVNLAAPEAGIIQTLQAKQGDTVSAGQAVALLDNAVLRVSLEAARAKADSKGPVLAAEADHRQRSSRLVHMRKLREKGHASPEEVERAVADAEISAANLATAREEARANLLAVKQIKAQLDRRTIRSPIDGVISFMPKRPGEFVSATDPDVATIVQIDRLRVIFQTPTDQISRLTIGGVVRLRISQNQEVVNGTVDFISPITDAQSNLVRVEVVIDNHLGKHRSGVRCELLDFQRLRRSDLPQAKLEHSGKPQHRLSGAPRVTR